MSRYIDADEFEKYINREEWETPDETWRPEREFGMIIDSIPTVDVKPVVRGEWKRRIVDNGFNADWVCNKCGHRVKTDYVSYNYCPNCGADMRGGTE